MHIDVCCDVRPWFGRFRTSRFAFFKHLFFVVASYCDFLLDLIIYFRQIFGEIRAISHSDTGEEISVFAEGQLLIRVTHRC